MGLMGLLLLLLLLLLHPSMTPPNVGERKRVGAETGPEEAKAEWIWMGFTFELIS